MSDNSEFWTNLDGCEEKHLSEPELDGKDYPCTSWYEHQCIMCWIEQSRRYEQQFTACRDLCGEMVEIMGWSCIECGGQYENGKWFDDEFGPMKVSELCPTCKKRNNLIHRYEQIEKGE